MNSISVDIETAPLPYKDDELPVYVPEIFDPESVKVGNLKDKEKIIAKIKDAECQHKQNESIRLEQWQDEQEKAYRIRALSPYTGQITCICMYNDDLSIPLYIGNGDGMDDEHDLLSMFWAMWPRYNQIITYNGYAFDIQYIIIRSMIHGIFAPYLRARGNKYIRDIGTDRHVDLINLFESSGKWQSLSTVAKAILGEDKSGTGIDAIDLFLQGKHEDLAAYCMRDAELTWKLWKSYGGF